MVSYQWTIKTTGDGLLTGGEDGTVYLSLHGLDHQLPEVLIGEPDGEHEGSFAKSGVASGIIEVKDDLGELQTGRLRTTAPWHVESVAVTDLSNGRCWLAEVDQWADDTGDFPLLRFAPCARSDVPPPTQDEPEPERPIDADPEHDAQRDDVPGSGLKMEIERLKRQLRELGAELEQRKKRQGTDRPFITYELVATQNGRLVPLDSVLFVGLSGGFELAPGTSLALATDPAEGFGLGGLPGRWGEFYPRTEPTAFGLLPRSGVLGWAKAARAWAIPGQVLEDLLGPAWQREIFD